MDPSRLMPDEELGRRISSTRIWKRVQRGVAPLALFQPRPVDNLKLSVDRVRESYLSDLTGIAVRDDQRRDRNFYGWATVTQDVASKSGRYIEPSPKKDNPYHADIVLPDDSDQHKTELAAHARCQSR